MSTSADTTTETANQSVYNLQMTNNSFKSKKREKKKRKFYLFPQPSEIYVQASLIILCHCIQMSSFYSTLSNVNT